MNCSFFRPLMNSLLCLAVCFSVISGARAQESATGDAPVVIRDTEIENDIRTWTAPVIKAAGLAPDSVKFVLIQSPEINAFVAGGTNIFIYTGLLESSDNTGQVIGVVAHELGHIAGGHLIRTREALDNASYESILGTILGIGAAIATGEGGAAAAVAAGTSSMAARNFLAHSRLQESSADQAALNFLKKAQMDPTGLKVFMGKLEDQELLPEDEQTEYIRTHPLTRNRIDALEKGVADSPYRGKALPSEWQEEHARMKAKLIGFITPEQVPWAYGDSDQSMAARYARAIAAYRQNDVQKALKLTDALIASEPQNPYFYELKGQMLMDFARVRDAVAPYEKAVSLAPDAALIRMDLGHALLESAGNDRGGLQRAIDQLLQARQSEPRSAQIDRLLATAYGRMGREPAAQLYLAEEALLQRRLDYAKNLAQTAIRGLPEKSREWLRAKDILVFVEQDKNGG